MNTHDTEKMRSQIEKYERAACPLFSSKECSSCTLLELPYGARLEKKLHRVTDMLAGCVPADLLASLRKSPCIPSDPFHSRTKLKYVVGEGIRGATIGILTKEFHGIDLSSCPLPPEPIEGLLHALTRWITQEQIPVYDVNSRSGELKGIILLVSKSLKECILRVVVRDERAFERFIPSLHALKIAFPWIQVISVNFQPLHAAIPEGPHERILTSQKRIAEQYNGITLFFGPQSFMQVTHEVAEQLYRWVADQFASSPPETLLDLFCGVGGFALSCARHAKKVVGIELSADAIDCAKEGAAGMGYTNAEFIVGDLLAESPLMQAPLFDALVVNPPRRGLGEKLTTQICGTPSITQLVYSSCNPETLARDLAILGEEFEMHAARAFDMFPLTYHMEVAVYMRR